MSMPYWYYEKINKAVEDATLWLQQNFVDHGTIAIDDNTLSVPCFCNLGTRFERVGVMAKFIVGERSFAIPGLRLSHTGEIIYDGSGEIAPVDPKFWEEVRARLNDGEYEAITSLLPSGWVINLETDRYFGGWTTSLIAYDRSGKEKACLYWGGSSWEVVHSFISGNIDEVYDLVKYFREIIKD